MNAAPHVVVVGAGLAGCWSACELARRGLAVTVIEAGATPASGASGNPIGVVKPRVHRQPTDAEAFYLAAFDHLLDRLGEDDLARACRFQPIGALQLTSRPFPPRERGRTDIATLDRDAARALSGWPLADGALAFSRGGALDPSALCHALVARLLTRPRTGICLDTSVDALERDARGWTVRSGDGQMLRADAVVLATGAALSTSRYTRALAIMPARGQIDRFARGAIPALDTVVTGASYAIPDGDTLWVGASYARGDLDVEPRATDTAQNRDALKALAAHAPGAHLGARIGVRATTPDRMPLVGPVAKDETDPGRYATLWRSAPDGLPPHAIVPGLTIIGGLGSRGIVTSALCADRLASWIVSSVSG